MVSGKKLISYGLVDGRYKTTITQLKAPIPSGGVSVYRGQPRICTDGSTGPDDKNGLAIPDSNWQAETAYHHKGKPIDAYTIPYIVLPAKNSLAKKGDVGLVINWDTDMYVWCVIGEVGSEDNGWGEVSIAVIWDTGYPNHMTANNASGISSNYEIRIYPGISYEWSD